MYVNYARIEDFIELTRDHSVDPRGHVCIARYGKIFRGSKGLNDFLVIARSYMLHRPLPCMSHFFVHYLARIAEDYGCTGLIIYSDPIDYTVSWAGVYPESFFLPGTGAQRGSLYIYKGDPLTPHYPAFGKLDRSCENACLAVIAWSIL